MNPGVPKVYLVGAGPGNLGLLTLRAVQCLERANLVIYDQLLPRHFIDLAPISARKLCVTDFPGSRGERSPIIVRTMIDEVRQGQTVVRLKGGDPFIFARGGDEARALAEANVPLEIVPGVTAALGAAAYAGIPLSERGLSSAVALVTGHEDPAKDTSAVQWGALAQFPGTLAIYMGIAQLPEIARSLLENGKSGDTPAAIIEQATTGNQRTLTCRLDELGQAAIRAGLRSPAMIIIGPVVSLRQNLNWFENSPLFGKQILIGRPRHQSQRLASKLEELGAVPWLLPALAIAEPSDWSPVDRVLRNLRDFDWLVFTSSNGVHATIKRLREVNLDLRAIGHARLAAIGPATADALRSYLLEPDIVPPKYDSGSLAEALKKEVAGKRVLLLRADRGRALLQEELAKVATVEQVAVYRQTDAVDVQSEAFVALREGKIDYVLLTSSNIARAILSALGPDQRGALAGGGTKLVSISPATSAAIAEFDLIPGLEASIYTEDGVLEALLKYAAGHQGNSRTVS
jgi:uroporphyrinogen III methyltransferase/synthase